MPTTSYFPVFEPDQVLTDTELNAMFIFLDQQEHFTRNKLIGIGIVCGLQNSWSGSTITITKGVGITSLGYLLQLDGGVYSHYRPYVLPDFPETIEPAIHAAYAAWSAQLLIPATQPKDPGDKALSANSAILKTHAVVLFVEPMLSDLKNCTTDDCNDKGKRVDLTVRPLLVPKEVLQTYKYYGLQQKKFSFPEVHFQRWNVPSKTIQHPANVMQAFDAVLNSKLIRELDEACKFVFDIFHSLLATDADDSVLNKVYAYLLQLLKATRSGNILHYQYLYDYVDDLIKAYHDFRDALFDVLSECCPDENLFPLHLMLGPADQASPAANTPYRNYFIYSPLFNQAGDKREEALLLYNRLVLMLAGFKLPAGEQSPNFPIRVTPSYLGNGPLGVRCIPYYYNPDPLFENWDFEKTRRGRQGLNYGYYASVYSSDAAAMHPLLYDTEAYNFFRIEGHMGKPVSSVLRELTSQKQRYNLPFDVVAVNLYTNNALTPSEKLKCNFSDLDSAYNVLLSELLCRLHGLYCAAGKAQFDQKIFDAIFRNATIFTANTAGFSSNLFAKSGAAEGESEATAAAAANIDINLQDSNLVKTYVTGFEESQIRVQVASVSFVDSVRGKAPYAKGTYMTAFCKPGAKDTTVARYYLNWVAANPGKRWPKPQALAANDTNTAHWLAVAYQHFFYLIDTIEEMLATVLPFDLSEINSAKFKLRYDEVMAEVEAYAEYFDNYFYGIEILREKADQAANKPIDPVIQEIANWLIDKAVTKVVADSRGLLMMCFDDALSQLLAEYRKRVAYVLQQHIFSNYAKLKTGLEHKAGVPRGGTFVLLYFDRPDRRENTLTRATFLADDTNSTVSATKSAKAEATTGAAASKSHLTDEEKLEHDILGVQKVLELNKDAFAVDELQQITAFLGRVKTLPASAETLQIPEGVVFADLYIPYMCCSDCAPTAFVFTDVKDTTPPDISIKNAFFCNHQDVKEPLIVSPDGGTVTGQGTITENGKFFFNPKGLAEGDYVLTYKVGEQTDTVTVTVKNTPNPEFTFAITGKDAAGATLVSFTPVSIPGQHSWTFGDTQPSSTEPSPKHSYFVAPGQTQTFNVTHSVTNGNCALSPVTKQVVVKVDAVVTLSIKNAKLCTNNNPEQLIYSPNGGTMTCPEKAAAIVNLGGISHFSPAIAGPGSYTVQYTSGGIMKEITVTVSAAPSPDFDFKVTDTTQTSIFIQFTSKETAGTHDWNFSDGQKSAVANPSMIFKLTAGAPGSVDAKHTVTTGGCQDSVSKNVPFQQGVKVVNSDLFLCYDVQPIPLEPNLGPNDKLTVIDSGGHTLSPAGMLTLDPKTKTGTADFKLVYRIQSGTQVTEKQIAVTLSRIDGRIKVTFAAAQTSFTSVEATASWTISAQNSTDPAKAVAILKDQAGNPLQIKTAQLPQSVEFALLIDVAVSGRQCKEALRKSIPAAQYNQIIKNGGTLEL